MKLQRPTNAFFVAAAIGGALLLLATGAHAQDAPASVDATTVLNMLKQSMAPAINTLTSRAISWLGVFATLQFFITNYNLLRTDGDLQAAIAKMVGAVAWVGICVYIINNGPQFIGAVGDQLFSLVGLELPSPGSIVGYTIGAAASTGALAIGAGGIPLIGNTAGMLLVYIAFTVLGVGMYFAFKIFMLHLELGLIMMLSPLSFSFLGLNTLRDQGIAPFKALLSLAYRIILLTVIMSAFGGVSEALRSTVNSLDKETLVLGMGKFIEAVLAALGAYLLLFYLTFKSDSIAATLSSGSTSMGTGDVAQAAAAGAAMGAAVATGGAAAGAAASRVPETMRDFMGSLMGGGSVNNASPMGNAAEPPPLPMPGGAASLSMGGGSPAQAAAGSGSSLSPSATSSAPGAAPSTATSAGGGSMTPGAAPVEAGGAPASAGATPGQSTAADLTTGKIGPDLSEAPAGNQQQPDAASGAGQGSGRTAGISGQQGDLADRLGELVDHMARQTAPRPPRLRDSLGEANRHMEKESAGVHVSVNTHHAD